MPEFLLEIGFEEMPSSWFSGPLSLAGQMKVLEVLAGKARLLPPQGQPFPCVHTPRRLATALEVLSHQAGQKTTIWGPAERAARETDGTWSPAILGFAAKNGVAPTDLILGTKDPNKPEQRYFYVERQEQEKPAVDVLPDVIATTLRHLVFAKEMSWDAWLDDGKGAFPFGRPIRWIVALLDGQVVPFTIYEMRGGRKGPAIVNSGRATLGHRFLPRDGSRGPIVVTSWTDLQEKLRASYVLVGPGERSTQIKEQLDRHNGGQPVANDHGLAAEWRDLVEYPTVLAGQVPAEFRSLPTEVLETVLVHHQKYVPLLAGGLVERFAAVTNGDGANAEAVVRNMERVVVARLRDAAFFFAEDRKRRLEDRLAELAGITFHRELGTYADKTDRLNGLRGFMSSEGWIDPQHEREAAKAASFCKADLVTLMVREFPELQGVMGGIYLQGGDVPEDTCLAVKWHYHPISVEEGAAPAQALDGRNTAAFAAVSLADKLDTLAGYFGIGLVPTGSSDPFGLRRAAQGAVRVLLDFWPDGVARPSLRRLVAQATEGFAAAGKLKRKRDETQHNLEGFLLDRLRYVLVARGFPADEVEAVLAAREPDALDDPHEALLRLRALHRVRSEASEDFAQLAAAFKRAKNILGDQELPPVVPALFQEEAEGGLHRAVSGLQGGDGGYEARLRSLAGLRGPVDRFFDDVLVMAEDAPVRANRLSLLASAVALFYRIADISRLGGQS